MNSLYFFLYPTSYRGLLDDHLFDSYMSLLLIWSNISYQMFPYRFHMSSLCQAHIRSCGVCFYKKDGRQIKIHFHPLIEVIDKHKRWTSSSHQHGQLYLSFIIVFDTCKQNLIMWNAFYFSFHFVCYLESMKWGYSKVIFSDANPFVTHDFT